MRYSFDYAAGRANIEFVVVSLRFAFGCFACCWLTALSAFGQGTIDFRNFDVGSLDYPISDCHGPLTGSRWTAQLWIGRAGSSATNLNGLLPTTVFRSDAPGYFVPVTFTVQNFAPGAKAALQIRVWDNNQGAINDFSNATIRAASPVIEVVLGGWGSPPNLPVGLTPLGAVPKMFVSSSECVIPTNQCCYEIAFTQPAITVFEGSFARIPFRRNVTSEGAGPPGVDQSAGVTIEEITAHAGSDFLLQPQSLAFMSASSGYFTVSIPDNAVWNGTRVFKLHLVNPDSKVVLGKDSVETVTILDNDTVLAPYRRIDGPIDQLARSRNNTWLILGGFAQVDGYPRYHIARVEIDGILDPTFDPGSGPNGSLKALTIQGDGKILVGGDFTSFAAADRNALVRLDDDGKVDPTFVPALERPSQGSNEPASIVRTIVIQSDAKILVGGTGLNAGSLRGSGIVRLNADGSLDPFFLPPAGITNTSLIRLQPDGKMLVAGAVDGSLWRLLTDGSPDQTWRADLNSVTNHWIGNVTGLALLPDGRLVVAGQGVNSPINTALVVVKTNGQPAAASMQINLKPITDVRGANLWMQADQILISGFFGSVLPGGSEAYGTGLLRLNADLTRDTTFNFDPALALADIAFAEDGMIAGAAGRIIFFEPDGTLRESLHVSGIARLPDGELQMALRGYAPWGGWMETSSDLMTWTVVTNSNFLVGGKTFKDVISTNAPRRFYRAMVP